MSKAQGSNAVADVLESRSFTPLAEALRSCVASILVRWESLVREVLPAADDLTLTQVRDGIPVTLARLADALEAGTPAKTRFLADQADGHGSDRFQQGYNIEELIIEYRLLRRVVVEEVESALRRRATRDEDTALSMGVDAVLQQGVVSFVKFQAEELRTAVDAESKFLSYLSHDLRNHLNHVSLVLEVLAAKLGDSPAAVDELADIDSARKGIFETVESMERILRAARQRKPDGGDAGARREPVDLAELAEAIGRGFRREAEAKGLKLVIDVPPGTQCHSDRRLLMLVLHNLTSNAIKYSDRGTVKLAVTGRDDGSWCLAVSDEGPGIAPEQQQRIFEEFVRGETHGKPGLGLGLAIAARAARLLDARLSVESTPGKGTSFHLTCAAVK